MVYNHSMETLIVRICIVFEVNFMRMFLQVTEVLNFKPIHSLFVTVFSAIPNDALTETAKIIEIICVHTTSYGGFLARRTQE